jgi:hypothetical protein
VVPLLVAAGGRRHGGCFGGESLSCGCGC